MRLQDELILLCGGRTGTACKFLLSQMETLSRAFDSEELRVQLQLRTGDEQAAVRNQAVFSMSRFWPGFVQRRYAVTDLTGSMWSDYSTALGVLGAKERAGQQEIEQDGQIVQAALLAAAPLVKGLVAAAPRLSGWNRIQAHLALGYLGLRESKAFLTDAVRASHPELAPGLSLAQAAGPTAADALTAALKNGAGADPDLYLLLPGIPGPSNFQMLMDAIPKTVELGRINLARALTEMPEANYLEAFKTLCRVGESWVQIFALTALETIGEPAALPALRQVYERARHRFLRIQAIKSAGGIHAPESPDLCKAALADPDPGVQAVALESLVRLRIPRQELREAARPFLASPHLKARVNALIAAVGPDEILDVQSFQELLLSRASANRLEAAYCLGYLQSRRGVEVLWTLATLDPDGDVKQQAIKALGRYQASTAIPYLLTAIQADDARTAATAASVLGRYELQDAQTACDALREGLAAEQRPATRALLYRALGLAHRRSQSEKPDQTLAMGLDETDAQVLQGVVDAWLLVDLGRGTIPDQLHALSRYRDPHLRAQSLLCRWNFGELNALEQLGRMLVSGVTADVSAALGASLDLGVLIGEAATGRFPLLREALLASAQREDHASLVQRQDVSFLRRRERPAPVPADLELVLPAMIGRPTGNAPVVGTSSPLSTGSRQPATRKTVTGSRSTRPIPARGSSGSAGNPVAGLKEFLAGSAGTGTPSPDLREAMSQVTYLVTDTLAPVTWLQQIWSHPAGKAGLVCMAIVLAAGSVLWARGDALSPPPVPKGFRAHLWVEQVSGTARIGREKARQHDVLHPGDILQVDSDSELSLATPQHDQVVLKSSSRCQFDGVGTGPKGIPHYRFREASGEVVFAFKTLSRVEVRYKKCRLLASGASLAITRTPEPQTLTILNGDAQLDMDGVLTRLHRNTTLKIP